MRKIKCPHCNIMMDNVESVIEQDGISFRAHKCNKCGEEILDMDQLKNLADKYKKLRDAKSVKFSKWGNSLAVRIPKELTEKLALSDGKKAYIIEEKNSLKIML